MAVYPGFVDRGYRSLSLAAADDLLINLYPEILEGPGASKAVFYGAPGTQVFCVLPTTPVRGTCYLDGLCFALGGNKLYRISSTGIVTICAGGMLTSPPGTGVVFLPVNTPVSMQTDGKTVVMAINGYLWVYDINDDSLIKIDAITGAGLVSYSDGYYLVNVPGTNKFFISDLFNGLSWNPLDFAVKEGFPDNIIGQLFDHRELWLHGSRTTEVWWNTGNPNFPFERIQGPFPETGLGAAYSIAKIAETHVWLSENAEGGRMIWRAKGYTPERISDFAMEYAMSTYARVDDAVAFTYQELGHSFYVITFPSAVLPGGIFWDGPGLTWDQAGAIWDAPVTTSTIGATWVLDVGNGMWHQRDYLDPQFAIPQQIRGWNHMFAFGRHLVGDYQNGNIYDQSVAYFVDAYNSDPTTTTPIRRLRRAPHIVNERRWIKYPGMELHIQEGVVPQTGPGSTPQFQLRKSSDGGFTFGNYLVAAAGKVGRYRDRVIWRRLGEARDAVFEVSSDEPILHAWVNAYLTPDPVPSGR